MILSPRVAESQTLARARNGSPSAAAGTTHGYASVSMEKTEATESEATAAPAANTRLTSAAMNVALATGTRRRSNRPTPASTATSRRTAMSIPARVANDRTKAAWVMTVATPYPARPSVLGQDYLSGERCDRGDDDPNDVLGGPGQDVDVVADPLRRRSLLLVSRGRALAPYSHSIVPGGFDVMS